MTRGDDRALTAYLLVLTPASKEPWTVTFDSRIWARALGIQVDRPAAAISKVWRRLEERRLITRSRSGRLTVVTPLREDGSGEVYTRPDGKKRADHYLKLDHRFWTDDWYRRLSLAGKAVLLIGLSSTPKFELPYERAPKWYGISADTVERGFKELLGHELISYTTTFRAEPLSPTGSVEVRQWSLKGPFIRSAR